MESVNNKLILEPYKGEHKVKANVQHGFATIKQKSNLVGLKLLADAKLTQGNSTFLVPRGTVAYFEEEVLYSQEWPRKRLSCDELKEEFVIGDYSQVRGFSGF